MMNKKLALATAVLMIAAAAFIIIPSGESDGADVSADITVTPSGTNLIIYAPAACAGTATYAISSEGIDTITGQMTLMDLRDGTSAGNIPGFNYDEEKTYTINLTFNNGDEGSKTFGASVEPETAVVTIAQPENGTITVTNEAGEAVESGAFELGTVLTVTVVADEGYQVVGETNYDITVSEDITIDAEIEAIPGPETAVVTIAQPENGTITVTNEAGEAVESGAFELGTVLTVTVVADEGYQVVGETNYDITVSEDITITAEIIIDQPEIDHSKRAFTNTITLGDGAIIDSSSAIIASYTQEVIISGDVTVVDGGIMTIYGKLTIAEGAVLTIENGGAVEILEYGIVDVKGDLVIEGSDEWFSFIYSGIVMTVSGKVSLEGADSFLSTGDGIEISGLFEIGDEATAQLDDATITKDGRLLINGVAFGEITNNGEVVIDSQGLEDGTCIDLVIEIGADATVDIINVFGFITICDHDLKFDQGRVIGIPAQYDNEVTLVNVAGVKVTEILKISEKNGVYTGTNTMNIAGTIVTAVDYNATVESGIVATGGDNVATSGDVVLGDNITLDIEGKFTVSAKLDAVTDGSKIIGNGEMTVEGKVTVKVAVPETLKVNAARYTTASPAYTIYTTLETALTDGATVIALMGSNTVSADATISVGTTVTMENGSKLTVSEDAVLTVAADDRNSARFNTAGVDTVDVKGTLVVVNFAKSKVTEDAVLSDTAKTVDKTRTYTNIYNALAAAADGETVEITRGADLVLSKDVEVKSGITLSIPAGEKVVVDNGITVTVNGTVYAAGYYFISEAIPDDVNTAADESKPAGATVVNGLFLYAYGADYTNYIVGAYFEYAYNTNSIVNAIAPLASMPTMMEKVESDYIALVGEMIVGAVDFSAYDGDVIELYILDKFNFDSITVGSSMVFIAIDEDYVSATGTIILANGSVDVKNVNGIALYNKTDNDDVTTSYFDSNADAYDNPETTTVEKGSISFAGTIVADLHTTSAVSVAIPVDATVTVICGDVNGVTIVDGAMVINGTGIVFQKLTVNGAVTAEKNNVAQAVQLFVGVAADDFAKAGTGSVAGVTLVNSASAVAYVSPNATVGEDITELKSTEYYVEDALYLTAYAVAGNEVAINGVKFTIQNAWFDSWTYTKNDRTEDVDSEMVIGDASKVYADIVYEIFDVYVIVDSGIGAVAIDGNVLVNYTGNIFATTTPLKAGQHTVTYTLKSGYTGTAKLSVNGEGATVSGNSFSLAGTSEDEDGIEVQLSLFGTEVSDPIIIEPTPQPAEKDEGLALTDILLIVLVILAVILVVVVAIRMMRS